MALLKLDFMTLTRRYIVLVPEAVVAQDLAQTIQEFDMAADVICPRSPADAERLLESLHALEVAFVAGRPSTFVGTDLHDKIVRRGGRLVLMGVEAEATGPTPLFDVLAQPFDTESVLAKLQPGPRAVG